MTATEIRALGSVSVMLLTSANIRRDVDAATFGSSSVVTSQNQFLLKHLILLKNLSMLSKKILNTSVIL